MLATLGAMAAPTPGDDEDLEALLKREVQGPSRYAQSLLDAPAPVAVLGRAESERLGHTTVADMLVSLPGIHFSQSRQYLSVGLRGLNRPGDYNARLLTTIDGFRFNEALYDQALPEYEFPIVAEWVKRLELVYGPSSSVYGANALWGVVSVVTVDGADLPGLRLSGSLGSFGTRRALLQYGSAGAGGDLFVGMHLMRSRGEDLELPELNLPDGRARGLDGTRHASLFAKWRKGAWRLSASLMQRDKDVATAPYNTLPGEPGTTYRDRFAHLELAYVEDWREALRRTLRLGWLEGRFDGHYRFADGLYNHDLGRSRRISVDARLQWRGWLNHELMAGVDGHQVPLALQRNYDTGPEAEYLNDRRRSHGLGAFVQDQWRLSPYCQLTAGLRVDAIEGFQAETSPRLALLYRPRPDEALKLLVGRAFRTPNLAERFYSDGDISQQANPGLQPERLHATELVWERALDARTQFTAGAYRTHMKGVIELVELPNGLVRYENLSGLRSQGLDLGLAQRLGAASQWRLSLSWIDARDGQGVRLDNAPRWLVKGHWIQTLAPHWSLGVEALGMGARRGVEPVPAHLVANASLRFSGWSGQELALRVRNLGDRAAHDPAGPDNGALLRVPQPRRSLHLDWQVRF